MNTESNNEPFRELHAATTERIIGAFYEVSNELGYGFVESVYRRSLLIALTEAGLRVEEEVAIPVSFRNKPVGIFHADLVVENTVILELKVAEEITKSFELQLLNYLRGSVMEIGLVLAFGQRAKFRRVVMSNDRKPNLHGN